MVRGRVCVVGGEGMHGGGGGGVMTGEYMTGGMHVGGRHVWWGAYVAGGVRAGEAATEACGTNPTGMYSCICIDLQTINDQQI